MAHARLRMFRIVLAIFAGMIVAVLTPEAGLAHGSEAAVQATAAAVAIPAAGVDQAPRAVVRPSLAQARASSAQVLDLARPGRDGGDPVCPNNDACCSAACHMLAEIPWPVVDVRPMIVSAGVPSDESLMLGPLVVGLFRPPRSL